MVNVLRTTTEHSAVENTADRQPKRRIVLLGASNLTRAFSTVVETSRRIFESPLEILAALGHGRSYGMHSSVLGRRLPGILQCGLWEALRESQAQRPDLPTYALITDIGNDLVYGMEVSVVVDWLEQCLNRLEAVGSRVVMTLLPVASLEQLGRWRYSLFKSILFPSSAMDFDTVTRRALELNSALESLVQRQGVHGVIQSASWYGWDPIHMKMRLWPMIWKKILSNWNQNKFFSDLARGSLRRWCYLRCLKPELRWFFGNPQRHKQPAGRLSDGTTVSIY